MKDSKSSAQVSDRRWKGTPARGIAFGEAQDRRSFAAQVVAESDSTDYITSSVRHPAIRPPARSTDVILRSLCPVETGSLVCLAVYTPRLKWRRLPVGTYPPFYALRESLPSLL